MGHHGAVPIRVTTWNLQGRARPDLGAVAEVLTELEPDVVLLQEVQRRQVERLSAALGWSSAWRWKHWPMVYPAEGLALLSPHALAEPQSLLPREDHMGIDPRSGDHHVETGIAHHIGDANRLGVAAGQGRRRDDEVCIGAAGV